MSNHLKRLSDIFGSFVSKDFKRKRLQDESVTESKPDEYSPVKLKKFKNKTDEVEENEFMSVDCFVKRVATFTDFCWCRDIPQLSPLEIARHGWASTGDDFMVTCESCNQHLSLAIPDQDSGIRESCINTAVGRLFSAHGEFCPWATTSSPAHLARIEVPDLEVVGRTAANIAQHHERLPYLKPCHVEKWQEVLKKINKDILKDIEDERVMNSACILALCGWRPGSLEDTLTDVYAVRRIGIWNFVSIQDEDDILETQRVAEELGHSLEKDRSILPEGKEYLDPVSEHVSWHPILQNLESGTPAHQHIINQLCKGPSATCLIDKLGKKDSIRAIFKVRDIVEQW